MNQEHKFRIRENSEVRELRGYPMYVCRCGKKYQTKVLAARHCIEKNLVNQND